MTILEWMRLPKDEWKPATAVFGWMHPDRETAMEIERQIKALEAERDSARDKALENAANKVRTRGNKLFTWMNTFPINSDNRKQLSLRAGELFEAEKLIRSMKKPSAGRS